MSLNGDSILRQSRNNLNERRNFKMENNQLYHHGVKGMKWGVRRWQNKDGSLTPAGKKRRGESDDSTSTVQNLKKKVITRHKAFAEGRAAAKEARAKRIEEEKARKAHEEKEAKKKAVLESRSAKELYDNADLFDTQELQAAYQRLQLERNISSLAPKDIDRGSQFIDNAIKAGRKFNDITDVGMKSYNNIAKIYNTFSDEGRKNPWPIIRDNDKGDDKDKSNKNQNNQQSDKKTKDKGSEDQYEKTTDKTSGQASSKKNKTESKTSGDGPYTGTVEGEGKSQSNIKNESEKTKSSKPADYYDPIDVETTTVSNLPAVTVNYGKDIIDDWMNNK